ncbi:MAG: hypothetical protein KF775_17855 [Cyclobacteriaceae bacterium]|nr:hypothetical protein [Cyclobacteriaceae bacterium]
MKQILNIAFIFVWLAGYAGSKPDTTSAYNAFEKLERTFTAPQPGYLYVYVANESNTATSNVYWDELLIVHQKNNPTLQVTQASDYYPFGLPFNAYQAQRITENYGAVPKNRYGFQGQEWQSDLGLGWSQFKWRMHDPAIGRFSAVDPLSDKYLYNSTYAFSENLLTAHLELEGLEAAPAGKMNSPGVAYVYYVGGDNFDFFGLGGHTSVGYYGMYTYEREKTLYLPLQGHAGEVEQRKFGPDSFHYGLMQEAPNERPAISEAKTIKYYLDGGEIVQRMHYDLTVEEMKAFAEMADSQWANPNTAEGIFCTCQASNMFYQTFMNVHDDSDVAQKRANKIIGYRLPEELSKSEVLKSGSTRFDRFYKENDKYYHSLWRYNDKKWTNNVNEITIDFDQYFKNVSEY